MSVLSRPFFHDEAKAYEFLEGLLWPNGPTCPHCGNADAARIGTLKGKSTRIGVRKCYECRKPFTVKVGTVFESSHVKLNLWLQAAFLITSSKKGFSAHQLHRTLDVHYRTAWFMLHRLREAMRAGNLPPLGGEGKHVEADEVYYGNKPGRKVKRGTGHKRVIVSLVERGGDVRSFHVETANIPEVKKIIDKNLDKRSTLNTDEAAMYKPTGKEFAAHQVVNHQKDEYVRGSAYTNTLEGYFSIFKKGMTAVYQHCSEKHLHRYLSEYDFRYSNRSSRGIEDAERAEIALKGIVGKRLTYKPTHE